MINNWQWVRADSKEVKPMCVWEVCVSLMLDAHLGNGTGHRTVTMTAPLLPTSGLVRYEAVFHNCRTCLVGEGYQLVTLYTHGDFIVLPHWNTWLLASSHSITLS